MNKENNTQDNDINKNSKHDPNPESLAPNNTNINEYNNTHAINQTYDDIYPQKKIRKQSQFDNDELTFLDQLSSPLKVKRDKNQSFDIPIKKKDVETESKSESSNNSVDKLKEEIAKLFDYINSQRDIGNKAFKKNQMIEAENSYTKAIDYLNHYTLQNTIQHNSEVNIDFIQEKKKALKILKENLSMTQAKLGKFYQAICTANDIIINYDPLAESTYRRLLSWYIKINEIEKAKQLSEEIKGKFSDQSVFIPYFETLAKKEIATNYNMINSSKPSVDVTSWIVGLIGITSATIAIVLMWTKKKD